MGMGGLEPRPGGVGGLGEHISKQDVGEVDDVVVI